MPQPRTRLHALAAVAWLAAACASPAGADDVDPLSPLRLSGYGSVSHSRDNRSDLAPIRDITQRPNGSAAAPASTWQLDSRVGLQLALRFSPQVEAVVQGVVRDQVADGFDAGIELAHVDFNALPGVRLRVGRIGFDGFLMSDHRNLGYAYSWARPPREFYGWIPLFSIDGADLTVDLPDADAAWRLKAQAGSRQLTIPVGQEDFEFAARSVWNLSLDRQQGPWRLKAGLSGMVSGNEAGPLRALHDGLAQIAAAGLPGISDEAAGLRQQTAFRGARIRYQTLGVVYDDGVWQLQAELGRTRTSRTIAPGGTTGYVAAGRRFGNLTPFAVLAASRPQDRPRAATGDWTAINQAALQSLAYFALNGTRVDQASVALGTRWDFDPNAALKLQWEHARIRPLGYGAWFRALPTNATAGSVRMLTLSLDFAF